MNIPWTKLLPREHSFPSCLFLAYIGGTAALLPFLAVYYNPRVWKVYGAYEWGYWPSLSAIWVVVLAAYLPSFFSEFFKIDRKYVPVSRGLMLVVIFVSPWAVLWPQFGSDFPGLFLWWLIFGALLGLIENVYVSEVDFSFIQDTRYSVEARRNRLKHEHDKWYSALWGFSAFWLALLAIFVSFALKTQETTNPPKLLQLLFWLVGLAIPAIASVYWRVFSLVNSISDKMLEL